LPTFCEKTLRKTVTIDENAINILVTIHPECIVTSPSRVQ